MTPLEKVNSHISSDWPEGRVVSVALDSGCLNLRTTLHNKSGHLLNHLLGFCVHWGGDFKQPISTGTQITLYYCTVRNWPSYTSSLEPIEDKERKEEQGGGTGLVNGQLYGCDAIKAINEACSVLISNNLYIIKHYSLHSILNISPNT